ncbi:hypothetical protein IGS68_15620 [Skermanella sp. TT6]|uniref:DDE domain-containing protein n=1 Tax=Skermanella cutis TaxID=2775420 RepID=A0ABX7B0Z9_9PROT|nr:hypothetical protein [Skermanella sp. TT6]QQP87529.1 hypothetical protein IGS68_15620 [Skermanella sp. TT6]
MDEVVLKIAGQTHYLWRTVDLRRRPMVLAPQGHCQLLQALQYPQQWALRAVQRHRRDQLQQSALQRCICLRQPLAPARSARAWPRRRHPVGDLLEPVPDRAGGRSR